MNSNTPYPTSPNEPLATPTAPGSGAGHEQEPREPDETAEPRPQPIHEPIPTEPASPPIE